MGTKYEYRRRVIHCCGHAVIHLLHARNRKEADSWAHNLRKSECPACRDRNLSAINVTEKELRKAELPDLHGAAALVAWAGVIRSKIHGAISRSGRYRDLAYLCRYETSVEQWIEHRTDRFCDIVAHLRELERGGEVAA